MQPIMVGVDASREAAGAEAWAARLAAALGTDLVVATVWHPPEIGHRAGQSDRGRERRRTAELLDGQWTESARNAGASYRTLIVEGATPDALAVEADRIDPWLMVIGTGRTPVFAGLRSQSFSDWSAHRATRPLAVIPSPAPTTIEHLVVGLDGAPGQEASVAFATSLASQLGTRVTAVHAYAHPNWWRRGGASWMADAEQALSEWCRPLSQAGVHPVLRVIDSAHPAQALLDTATDVDADLIVVGARALSQFRLIRLGGVTMQLLHHSDRPVIIVPPAEEADGPAEEAEEADAR